MIRHLFMAMPAAMTSLGEARVTGHLLCWELPEMSKECTAGGGCGSPRASRQLPDGQGHFPAHSGLVPGEAVDGKVLNQAEESS
jgi:hypothetical protein